MRASIENFRGISAAQIEIAPIALLVGHNGAGKTSIARAIAAAATGQAVPFDKLTKKDCGIMLHNGSKKGEVTLEAQDGLTTVAWPKAEVKSEGRPPFASPIAAGLDGILSMKDKDAITYLINLLKASVSEADFKAAVAKAGLSEETVGVVWKTIDAQGWEAAHARAKETGTKLKGAWEKITGEKYGSDKAKLWKPEGFDETFANSPMEDLEGIVAVKRKALETAIANNAVTQSSLDSLKTLVDNLPIHEAQKKSGEALLKAAEEKLATIEQQLRENPNPNNSKEYECPHCTGKVHIKAVSGSEYVLSKAAAVPEVELRAARELNAKLCGEQQNQSREVAQAKANLQNIESQILTAQTSAKRLEELKAQGGIGDASVVESARRDLADAENVLNRCKAHRDASATAAKITTNQTLMDMLDETGIRKERLEGALVAFASSYVSPLGEAMGMGEISLDSSMAVKVGKLPYQMLSASEQYRVQVAFQLAIAQLENADIVIIDGMDIVEPSLRGPFLQAILSTNVPAIICCTLSSTDKAPNLAQAGFGTTYWVEGGTCAPIGVEQVQEAEAA